MTQQRIDIDGVTFSELADATEVETINPFGDRYIATLVDSEGTKFSQISTNAPAEIFAREPTKTGDADNPWEKQFTGYVVESRELQEGTRDKLEVTIYSFDQLLRNERITNDQSGKQIFAILEDIIKTDTPVTWNAANVSVGDNRVIDRSLKGIAVEDALRFLVRRSENETYGVNDSQEFFFTQRQGTAAERDISDRDVINWDIPERAKETKNQVTVWFNNDNESVEVSAGNDQLEVQDSLGTDSPVPFPDEISRPTITDRQEAVSEGRGFLRQREDTLTGEVTCVGEFGFFSNEVGDTVSVTITPRGIDDEFVIVSKEVSYLRDTVTFGLVEKRGEQDSLLKAIGKQVKREELSNTNRDSDADIVTQTQIRADIQQSYATLSPEEVRVTTTCRNKLRDAWFGDTTLTISSVRLGSGESISRADQSVPNVVDTSSVSPSSNGTTAVDVGFSLTGTGNILGFEDTNGDLLLLALFDEDLTDPSDTLTLSVNDSTGPNGVLTISGQETLRDAFLGNTTNQADTVAFGSGDTSPSESDTSLVTQEIERGYTDIPITSADTTSELTDLFDFPDDQPIEAANDEIAALKSCFYKQTGDFSNTSGSGGLTTDSNATNTTAYEFTGDGSVDYDITTNYTIPADDSDDGATARLYVRARAGGSDPFRLALNLDGSQTGTQFNPSATSYEWFFIEVNDAGEIASGSHTIEVDANDIGTSTSDNVYVDLAVLVDTRFDHNFTNTLNADDALAGPEEFPDAVSVQSRDVTPPQKLLSATLDTTFNDTSNNQAVSLTLGDSTSIEQNSETVTQSVDPATTPVSAELTLSRFSSDTTTTPTQGDTGQSVSLVDINGDIEPQNITDVGRQDVVNVLPATDVDGLVLSECAQLNSSNETLTRSIFPDKAPTNQAIIFSEDIGFDL